ncbi:MAG TPA: DUF1499 domain-containing protein [Thermoanaerobaculia bacterium]|nr:DUF1499 domain-containing protein [Thermoanaerobaculia bacterium]
MSRAAVVLAVLAVLSLLVSGVGTRGKWFHFRVGLALFALSGLLGFIALVLGFLSSNWIACAIGALLLLPAIYGALTAFGKPMIHDISTDPSQLDPAVAALQRKAYPEVQPLVLPVAARDAFARVRAAAESLGWTIVSASPDQGVLTATDTTGWFGFTDDVTVHVRAEGQGSRIDVRSTSRVGKSDVGMNARRIRKFLGKV